MASNAIQIETDAAIERFVFDSLGLEELLRGPVTLDLAKRAILVQNAAKLNARHTPPSQPGSGPAIRTGRLWGSITWRLGQDAISPYADVGSAVFYAPFVELGTRYMAARPFLRPALEAARGTF